MLCIVFVPVLEDGYVDGGFSAQVKFRLQFVEEATARI